MQFENMHESERKRETESKWMNAGVFWECICVGFNVVYNQGV